MSSISEITIIITGVEHIFSSQKLSTHQAYDTMYVSDVRTSEIKNKGVNLMSRPFTWLKIGFTAGMVIL